MQDTFNEREGAPQVYSRRNAGSSEEGNVSSPVDHRPRNQW